MSASRPGKIGCFWGLFFVLLIALGVSLLLNLVAAGALAGNGSSDRGEQGEDEFPVFSEKHSYGSGDAKVVRISFSGIMTRELEVGWLGTSDPVESCIRQIRAARQDEDVEGILLEVDSPGGGVTEADEIHRELMLFKESDEERRVVVLVKDIAASGGYYIAVPADLIVAQPTAIIGSVGVIMQTINFQGLSEKIGVQDTTIKSGKNKDMLNPFRAVDPEQIALLQESIDELYERFVSLVAQRRGLEVEQVKPLADGRIFTAELALQHDLIDAIGYWDEAMIAMAVLLDEEEIYVVTYESEKSFFETLMETKPRLPNLQSLWANALVPRRMFLWRP